MSLEPFAPILSQGAHGVFENEKSATLLRGNFKRIRQISPRPTLHALAIGSDQGFSEPRTRRHAMWATVRFKTRLGDPLFGQPSGNCELGALVATPCPTIDHILRRLESADLTRPFEMLDDKWTVFVIHHAVTRPENFEMSRNR